jgi:hypothetical protein
LEWKSFVSELVSEAKIVTDSGSNSERRQDGLLLKIKNASMN